MEQTDKFLVLIVDDNPLNIQVLAEHIKSPDVDIAIAINGKKAVSIATGKIPDLILLDVMMPDMDGFEVCNILKSNESTKDIPIVFLTAKVSTEDIVHGFELGAVDYVTKPFNPSELKSRVNTQLQIQKFKKQVISDKKALEKLNKEKNEFLGIAAHDLKNPIYSIQLLSKVIRDQELDKSEMNEFINDIITSTDRMLEIITNLLDINAIESGNVNMRIEQLDVFEHLNYIVESYIGRAKNKNIELIFNYSSKPKIDCDLNSLKQILDNLISNAIKYSPSDKHVFVNLFEKDNKCRFEVVDQGPGINEDDMKKLFGKFTKLSARPTGNENSTGLGLSIVKTYTEANGGKVWCESEFGNGSKFIVEFPLSQK